MRPPPFLKVLPADIGRVGVLGACILALVRYVTGPADENDGRKIVDGEMWWCASHDDIGRSLGGVHRDSIRRALVKLHSNGDLLAIPAERRYGDRAQAYRVPDVPLRGTQQANTRNTTSSCGETQQAAAAKSRNLPTTEELEEVGENARASEAELLDVEIVLDPGNAHPPTGNPAQRILELGASHKPPLVDDEFADEPDPEPQPFCDLHMPHGTDASCGACGRRRRTHEQWQQRQQDLARTQALSRLSRGRPRPVRVEPEPKPEPPTWIRGPHGPRCPPHGHHRVAPADCARCRDAAAAAKESA